MAADGVLLFLLRVPTAHFGLFFFIGTPLADHTFCRLHRFRNFAPRLCHIRQLSRSALRISLGELFLTGLWEMMTSAIEQKGRLNLPYFGGRFHLVSQKRGQTPSDATTLLSDVRFCL